MGNVRSEGMSNEAHGLPSSKIKYCNPDLLDNMVLQQTPSSFLVVLFLLGLKFGGGPVESHRHALWYWTKTKKEDSNKSLVSGGRCTREGFSNIDTTTVAVVEDKTSRL